jgi:hypothetical protein
MTGFPKDSLKKVTDILEANQLSYKIIEITSREFKIICEHDFGLDNSYENICSQSKKYVRIKKKLDSIDRYITKNIDNIILEDVVNEIENIIHSKIN